MMIRAAGASGRPFTIPTSLISTIIGMTAAEFIEGVPATLAAGVLGYLTSIVNVAYMSPTTPAKATPDLAASEEVRFLSPPGISLRAG